MILVLNTAEETLQIALAEGGLVLESFERRCAGSMNEIMAPAAAGMLKRFEDGRDAPPRGLAAVACVRGPGGFTGVRLGLALGTGLCLARGIPMAGLDLLPLLAESALTDLAVENDTAAAGKTSGNARADAPGLLPGSAAEGRPRAPVVHVLTHSRAGRVYHQAFAPGSPALPVPLGPPRDLTLDEARRAVAESLCLGPAVLLGSGLVRNRAAFEAPAATSSLPADSPGLCMPGVVGPEAASPSADGPLPGALFMERTTPSPEVLAAAASRAAYDGPPVEALYLRGSDAEENLAHIASLRGLSEQQALDRLERARRAD